MTSITPSIPLLFQGGILSIEGSHLEKRGSVFTQCTQEEIEYFKSHIGDEVEDETEAKDKADIQENEIKTVSVDAKELISRNDSEATILSD